MKKNLKDNLRTRNHNRRIWQGLFASLGLALLLLLAACSQEHTAHNDTYTCPMHPAVVSDEPGKCPVCGMDLVRKQRRADDVQITGDVARLLRPPSEAVVASVRTVTPEYKSMRASVEATGVVTYDPRTTYSIPARVGGRLEKILVKYNFQPVSKGQKIAEIYSPELVAAQRELLFLLGNDPANESLIASAKTKLALLGLSPGQIARLTSSREQQNTFALYSPHAGYVVSAATASTTISSDERNVTDMGAMEDKGPMQSSQSKSVAPTVDEGVLPRDGMYVSRGQTLFRIVNTTDLRIELDLPQAGITVQKGDTVELSIPSTGKQTAVIDLVQPFFTKGENFVKIRIYTGDTAGLRVGQLVTANIPLTSAKSLWVPAQAVVDLGTEKIVFVKDRELFKPKRVTTGLLAENLIQITGGLASTDEIAGNAHFLVDSESFIKHVN